MKRIWIALTLLILVLASALGNSYYVFRFTNDTVDLLSEAETMADTERWDRAEELTEFARHGWADHETYLHVFLRHSDVDSIEVCFEEVLAFLRRREIGEYSAANARLIQELKLLANGEHLSLGNIL